MFELIHIDINIDIKVYTEIYNNIYKVESKCNVSL